ncbi:hypothetical protein GCM10007301_02180 [Azorhizobium oxalatiphilum]|uniref:Cyclic nucleotide-binding domain-containing protein n=1 Tax=Azorhizobium oxalatiphilum TaxID=980631 RepID=A0A917F3X3_9HYPH|nr:cyclic nucleotide-binding domain-containing protein [Azorhizobium oxalatiphilum]GGF46237.1 hypothetical protein GCM10007301_02180 [Azorhizobium oxalatiphilum]
MMNAIDMSVFARSAGTNVTFPAGATIFRQDDLPDNMYVVQSGTIEMIINGKVVDLCGPKEAFGFLSVIDGEPRTATARAREASEVSVIDPQRFRFMVSEIPHFAEYIMSAMAHRIRGMKEAI